ncbi:unnamed protein product [Rotaria magnacalcarata]
MLPRTTETINQLEVDFIALQEVDNFTMRHPVDQTLYIGGYDKMQLFQYFHFEKMKILKMVAMEYPYYRNNRIGVNGSQQSNQAKQIVQWMSDNIISTSKDPYVILMTGDYNTIQSNDAIKNVMLSLFDDISLVDDVCRKIIDPFIINGYTFDSLNPSK